MRRRARTLQSKKSLQRERARKWRLTIILALGFICWLAVIVMVLRLQIFQINKVEVGGNVEVKTENLVSIAEQAMYGNYYYFIPKTSIFFYPQIKIEEDVTVSDQKIQLSHVYRRGGVLHIDIVERLVKAVVCPSSASNSGSTSKASCIFADTSGYLFAPVSESFGDKYVEFVVPITPTAPLIGQNFISSDDFDKFIFLIDNVRKLGFVVNMVKIQSDGDSILVMDDGMTVYVRNSDSFEEIFKNLSLFVEQARLNAKSKKTTISFSSIDIRFGNNIFFRTK